MSDTVFRCSLCGWSAVLDPTEVSYNQRCHECQTGRLLRVERPTDNEWNEGVGLA